MYDRAHFTREHAMGWWRLGVRRAAAQTRVTSTTEELLSRSHWLRKAVTCGKTSVSTFVPTRMSTCRHRGTGSVSLNCDGRHWWQAALPAPTHVSVVVLVLRLGPHEDHTLVLRPNQLHDHHAHHIRNCQRQRARPEPPSCSGVAWPSSPRRSGRRTSGAPGCRSRRPSSARAP